MSAEPAFMFVSNSAEQATAKRRRVPVACSACRARKTRVWQCDGARPECGSCLQLGENCVYVLHHGNNERQSHTSSQSTELLQRLDKIEAAIRDKPSIERRLQRTSSKISPVGGQYGGDSAEPVLGDGSLHSAASMTLPSPASTKRDYATYQEDKTDGLATVAALSEDEDAPEDVEGPYYGPSSNISLIKQISSALLRAKAVRAWHQLPHISDRRPRRKIGISDDIEPSQSLEGLRNQAINPYELPPINDARTYISHFFSQVALFVSYLHERSFLEKFRSHITDHQLGRQSGVSMVWLGILNLVFAISRSTMEGHSPDSNKLATCEIFYQRAMKLGWAKALRGRSLEIVQFLHLKSAFLQSTERPLEVWTAHSAAVNAAYSIGLHTTRPDSGLSPLEKEVRLRTWYCLLIDDCALSTAWGRPALTPGVVPSLATSIEGDAGFYPASVPKRVTDMISSYLTNTVSLGLIGQTIINDLYDYNHESSTNLDMFETMSRTIKICWNIHKWKESLPAALQPPVPGEALTWSNGPELHITRLRYFLSLRFHYQQITAYRAVLSRFLDDSHTSDNSKETYAPLHRTCIGLLESCVRCCNAILDHVQIVIQASEEQVNLNGAWWLYSYYAFNASLVLCGILTAMRKHAEEGWTTPGGVLEDTSEAFRRGVKVMQNLDRGSPAISRCCNVLNRFADLLDLSQTNQQQTVAPPVDNESTLVSMHNPSMSNMSQWYSDQDTTYPSGNKADGMPFDRHQTAVDRMMVSANGGSGTAGANFGFPELDDLFDGLDSESYAAGFL